MDEPSKEDIEKENNYLKKRLWLNQAHWETDKLSLESSRMERERLMVKVIQLEIYICNIRDMYAVQLDSMQKTHPDWKDTEMLSKNFNEKIDVWFAEMQWEDAKRKEKIEEFRDNKRVELDKRHWDRIPEFAKNEKENSLEFKDK